MSEISIKWRGREVQNPVLRFLTAAIVTVGVAFGMIVLVLTLPLTLPLHFVLRLFGRRGFATITEEGGITYAVELEGFKRREPAQAG